MATLDEWSKTIGGKNYDFKIESVSTDCQKVHSHEGLIDNTTDAKQAVAQFDSLPTRDDVELHII